MVCSNFFQTDSVQCSNQIPYMGFRRLRYILWFMDPESTLQSNKMGGFFCKEHDEIFTTVLYWMYATGFEQKIADAIHRLIDILKNRYWMILDYFPKRRETLFIPLGTLMTERWKLIEITILVMGSCRFKPHICNWLVVSTPMKNMSSPVGITLPSWYGKIKFMFQTTNRVTCVPSK